jgi:peptidoglycan/LPS O-acetylase OafA/YrhL
VRLALMHRGETVVDNFFLISGFVVAYILLQELHRKRFNPLNFILNRIMR